MNISLLQCLKEQEEYDRILKKKSQGNLCPSDYLKQKYDHKHSISALINAHSDLDNLRLLTLNIAEFTEKRLGLQQLENIITSQDVKGDVDIICLTEILAETWNQFITELISKKKKPEKQSTIELNGVVYDCFINFSKPVSKRSKGKNKIKYLKNNNTAGCAVLVSKKFKERPHTVMFDMNPSLEQQEQFALNEETYLCLDQEGRLITLLFDKFCLITLYAPNNSEKYQDEFDIWQQCIINYIQNLQQALDEDYAIILTGDFNIKNDHLTYKNLEETCQLKEVKGITHSFYKKNSQDQLQIDYTFISANNKLFENMKTQLVEQFELVTEQNKYHIPFLSIFQNQKQNNSKSPKSDKKSQSSGEDSEDDIQDLIQMQLHYLQFKN